MKKVKSVTKSDTGNGPCIEIEFEDGEYIWISDIDGCGFPKENSWAVGFYSKDHDCVDIVDNSGEQVPEEVLFKMKTKQELRAEVRQLRKEGCEIARFIQFQKDEDTGAHTIMDILEMNLYPTSKYSYSSLYDRCCNDWANTIVQIEKFK